MKNEWNPEQYLKFNTLRIRPSIDLAKNLTINNPITILDIGCGPGNSTSILNNQFPKSKIIGIDNSRTMIEKVKQDYQNIEWLLMDATEMSFDDKFDIVFSNATIQWIEDQPKLFQNISELLTASGIFACQVPLFWEMPIGKLLSEIATTSSLKEILSIVNNDLTIFQPIKYYDILSSIFTSINIWQTDYIHVMPNHEAIYSMLESTGFKPYLSKLSVKEDKDLFEYKLKSGIKELYPAQKNGSVLFPFKRLFFVVNN